MRSIEVRGQYSKYNLQTNLQGVQYAFVNTTLLILPIYFF